MAQVTAQADVLELKGGETRLDPLIRNDPFPFYRALRQSQPFALDDQHVAHVAGVLECRPDIRTGPAPERGSIGRQPTLKCRPEIPEPAGDVSRRKTRVDEAAFVAMVHGDSVVSGYEPPREIPAAFRSSADTPASRHAAYEMPLRLP